VLRAFGRQLGTEESQPFASTKDRGQTHHVCLFPTIINKLKEGEGKEKARQTHECCCRSLKPLERVRESAQGPGTSDTSSCRATCAGEKGKEAAVSINRCQTASFPIGKGLEMRTKTCTAVHPGSERCRFTSTFFSRPTDSLLNQAGERSRIVTAVFIFFF